jgi:hypothetical protein
MSLAAQARGHYSTAARWRIFTSSEIRQLSENMNMSSLSCDVVFWGMVQTVLMGHRRAICMQGIKKYLASTVLSAALLFTGAANAMQIPQYDKMAQSNKKKYSLLLVEGAADALDGHGKHEQSQKLIALFLDKGDNGGFTQLEKNLQATRIINARNAKDPNNKQPPYEVEHALFITLKDNGIIVPVSVLLALGKDFKPSSPPSEKTK